MNVVDINKKIKELNKLKRLLSIPIADSDNVEEIIFKKYLELESVAKVAEFINGLGHRKGNRKYIANDISSAIKCKDTRIKNNELKSVVTKLFNAHKKGIKRSNW